MGKKISNVVIDEEGKQVKAEKTPFSGAVTRIDGKKIDPNKMKIKEEEKEEYDPRKHRLPHGVRRKIINDEFAGKSLAIGESKNLGKKLPVPSVGYRPNAGSSNPKK